MRTQPQWQPLPEGGELTMRSTNGAVMKINVVKGGAFRGKVEGISVLGLGREDCVDIARFFLDLGDILKGTGIDPDGVVTFDPPKVRQFPIADAQEDGLP